MHVQKLHIANIRSLRDLTIDLAGRTSGWHVILGDNGSGKSSVIRALALALVGPENMAATRQDWQDWIRNGSAEGRIAVDVAGDSDFDECQSSSDELQARILLQFSRQEAGNKGRAFPPRVEGDRAGQTVWSGGAGWFSASFGPFRRFSGGDKEYEKLFHGNPGLATHISAFGEDVALGEALRWLQNMQFKSYEGDEAAVRLLQGLTNFLNRSDLLPHGARIQEITSETVVFADGSGIPVPVEQMSDGFRSVLSMAFELLRGMAAAYSEHAFLRALNAQDGTIRLPGVVAIDEIDAHLHPTWQARIGDWFVAHFPGIQFFVTTHSPIICRSAANGSIWRLPAPGRDEDACEITGTDRERLINGSILDALDTECFGEDITRSAASRELMAELAELNVRHLRGGLTEKQEQRRQQLQRTLPSAAPYGVGGNEAPAFAHRGTAQAFREGA